MTSSEISRIHNNRIARHNFKYYGPDGTVYIGLADGRLRRISDGTTTIVSGGGVRSVTGLNTDTTDPANPVIQISVDGVTITGDGTPANPLVSMTGGGTVLSVTDDGNGVVSVNNTDPINPVVQFNGVNVDGVTITGDGTSGNPLVSSGSDTYQVKATATDAIPTFLDQKIACLTDSTITVTPSNISGFEYINIKVLWSPRTVFESRNADSVTLYPGDPVYIMGVDPITNIVDVGLADASNPAKMPAVGVVWQITMSPSTLGGVIMTGLYGAVVTDPIDGVTPVTGDKLYVKAGGGLTTTMPTGGDIVQLVGVVGNVSTLVTDGSIIVGELLSGSSGSTVTADIISPFLLMGG